MLRDEAQKNQAETRLELLKHSIERMWKQR